MAYPLMCYACQNSKGLINFDGNAVEINRKVSANIRDVSLGLLPNIPAVDLQHVPVPAMEPERAEASVKTSDLYPL